MQNIMGKHTASRSILLLFVEFCSTGDLLRALCPVEMCRVL